MKRPVFIARQSAVPSGLLGRVIAGVMAHETADLNEHALRLLGPSRSDRLLEVGFGHGRTQGRLRIEFRVMPRPLTGRLPCTPCISGVIQPRA